MPNCLLSCGVAKHINGAEITSNEPMIAAVNQLLEM